MDLDKNIQQKRGVFRAMSIEDLRKVANLPYWSDGEQTTLSYQLPLRRTPLRDGFWSLDWKRLARSKGLLKEIPQGELYELHGYWCARSPETHIACFSEAIDFLVPVGATIFAAQKGVVVELVESNTDWGDGPQYRDLLNYMTICHGRGHFYTDCPEEHSQYCHIGKGTASIAGISVGTRVEKGQVIGKVGLNGWTDRPHLHFVVLRGDNDSLDNPLTWKYKSLRPRFELGR